MSRRAGAGQHETIGRSFIIAAKVFIGNLSFQTTRNQLTDLLSEAGEIVDVYLPTDRVSGRPRGFAFVEFSSDDEAEAAIEKFNDHELDGRKLRVNPAEDRPRRPGGPRPSPSFDSPDGNVGGFPSFGGGGKGGGRPSRPKGSRRGLRRKKRSL